MTDDEVHAELRRRHPITASDLAGVLDQPRTAIDQALRRLAADQRAECIGTVAIPTGRAMMSENVYEARPLR